MKNSDPLTTAEKENNVELARRNILSLMLVPFIHFKFFSLQSPEK